MGDQKARLNYPNLPFLLTNNPSCWLDVLEAIQEIEFLFGIFWVTTFCLLVESLRLLWKNIQ